MKVKKHREDLSIVFPAKNRTERLHRKQSQSASAGRLNGDMLRAIYNKPFRSTIIKTRFINYSNHWISLGRQVARNTLSNLKKHKKTLKKLQVETIKLIPGHIAIDKVDFWFQDVARIGQKNTITRLWSMKGWRPKVVKQHQFAYAGHPKHIFCCCVPIHRRNRCIDSASCW
jgi:hypothetical protein